MSKTIVITGCSSGFGRATALHLTEQGWRVFATVRKEADHASLLAEVTTRNCTERLTPVICDITCPEQIAALAHEVGKVTPRLDALVNNAGTAFQAPLELLKLDGLRSQLEINVVGQMAVTQALLPLLKAARGTIINVTSVAGRIALPLNGAYGASKFAMEALSDVLRFELAPYGIRVVVIQPGSSATAIWVTSKDRAPGLLVEQISDHSPYARLLTAVESYFKQLVARGFPPQLIANKVLKILNDTSPGTRYAVPRQIAGWIFIRTVLPDRLWDRLMRRILGC